MSWKIGDLCVAKSKEFGWTNSQIKDINKDVAQVKFIEYEDGEEVNVSDLKQFGPFAVNKKGELIEDQAAIKVDYSGWKVGDACVAQWTRDGAWYNSKILHFFNENEILVQFVDYGNADFTTLDNLKSAGSPLKDEVLQSGTPGPTASPLTNLIPDATGETTSYPTSTVSSAPSQPPCTTSSTPSQPPCTTSSTPSQPPCTTSSAPSPPPCITNPTGARPKTGQSVSSAAAAKTAKKYDKLIELLQTHHPELSPSQALDYVKKLRMSNSGKLSGMSVQDIMARVAAYIQEDQDKDLNISFETAQDIAEELENIFPNFPPEILLQTARKFGTFESAASELFNFVPDADFSNKWENENSFSDDENNNVKERVAKTLLLLKDNDMFKKVTLTEKRDFNPEDALENKFRLAKGHYLSVSGQFASHIESIDYAENRTLMEVFERKKNQLKSEGKDAKEYLLFHGTDNVNIDSILMENFQMDYAGRNGQVYGRGVYFSEKTVIPNKYMVGTKKTLLLCRVLLGKEFSCEAVRDSDIPEGYDSKSVQPDEDKRASINVIKEVDQILPCFVLNLAGATSHHTPGLLPRLLVPGGQLVHRSSASSNASFGASAGPFQPGTISTCPYDASHKIPQDTMRYHLTKCKKRPRN